MVNVSHLCSVRYQDGCFLFFITSSFVIIPAQSIMGAITATSTNTSPPGPSIPNLTLEFLSRELLIMKAAFNYQDSL